MCSYSVTCNKSYVSSQFWDSLPEFSCNTNVSCHMEHTSAQHILCRCSPQPLKTFSNTAQMLITQWQLPITPNIWKQRIMHQAKHTGDSVSVKVKPRRFYTAVGNPCIKLSLAPFVPVFPGADWNSGPVSHCWAASVVHKNTLFTRTIVSSHTCSLCDGFRCE